MKNNFDKITLKKAFQYNLRAFKMLYKQCPALFISTALHSIIKAVTPYAGIYCSARIIEELSGNRNPDELFRWVLITLIVTAVLTMTRYLLDRYKTSLKDTYDPKEDRLFADKMLDMDFSALDEQHTYDLRSQIRQNSNLMRWGLGRIHLYCEPLVESVVSIVAASALTVSLFTKNVPASAGKYVILNHPVFAIAMIAILLLIVILAPIIMTKGETYWALSSKDAVFSNRLFSFFGFDCQKKSRALDMRIYNQQEVIKHYFTAKNSFSVDSTLGKYMRGPMGFFYGLAAALSAVFTGVVYLYVCLKAWAGAFGVGYVTQYVGAITSLTKAVSDILTNVGNMKSNVPFLETTFEFMDIPNNMYQGSLTTEKRSDRHYEVEFKDVSFKYPGSDTYALRHVSMKFQIGKRLAVVGMNGSGKTTFIKLLCRLYDPTEGQILLNGIDIRKYNYRDYMNIFSVVFQDFKLLPFSIAENIATSKEYREEKVIECLEKAGFGDRLKTLPKGIHTSLYKKIDMEGVEVSGGEAQKLAIARALYKDAAFIILDEPTAALDPIAEAEIYSKFNDIAGDKTAIYISHRLSSCRFCDDILVFHEGNVIEQGNHETLVANTQSKYYELWNAQAQYYT